MSTIQFQSLPLTAGKQSPIAVKSVTSYLKAVKTF